MKKPIMIQCIQNTMSEEFLKVARKEIDEELEGLQKILDDCHDDNDILKNSKDIEKHLHKIKGLAPMMNQDEIGEIAKINDAILKHVIANGFLEGTFTILSESHQIMKEIFDGQEKKDVEELKNKIKLTFGSVLSKNTYHD